MNKFGYKSFQEIYPDEFEYLEILWSFRGKLAHGETARTFVNQKEYILNFEFLKKGLNIAQILFNYLDNPVKINP